MKEELALCLGYWVHNALVGYAKQSIYSGSCEYKRLYWIVPTNVFWFEIHTSIQLVFFMWIKDHVHMEGGYIWDHLLLHMQQSLFCLENRMYEILNIQCLLIAIILPHSQVTGTKRLLLQGSNSLTIEPHLNLILDF